LRQNRNFQIFKMGGKGLGRAEMKLGRPRGNCQVEGERKKTIKKKRGPAAGPCMHGPTWPHGHAASRRTSTSWRPEASSSSSERTEKRAGAAGSLPAASGGRRRRLGRVVTRWGCPGTAQRRFPLPQQLRPTVPCSQLFPGASSYGGMLRRFWADEKGRVR
jgi:hypothetical protein